MRKAVEPKTEKAPADKPEEIQSMPQVLEEELSAYEASEILEGIEGFPAVVKDKQGNHLGDVILMGTRFKENVLTLNFKQQGGAENSVDITDENDIKQIGAKVVFLFPNRDIEIMLTQRRMSDSQQAEKSAYQELQSKWEQEAKKEYGELAEKKIYAAKNEKDRFLNELKTILEHTRLGNLEITDIEVEDITDDKIIRKKEDIVKDMMLKEIQGCKEDINDIPIMKVVGIVNLSMFDNGELEGKQERFKEAVKDNEYYNTWGLHPDKYQRDVWTSKFTKKGLVDSEEQITIHLVLIPSNSKTYNTYKKLGMCMGEIIHNVDLKYGCRITEGDKKKYKALTKAKEGLEKALKGHYSSPIVMDSSSEPMMASDNNNSLTSLGSEESRKPPKLLRTDLRLALKAILQPIAQRFKKSSGETSNLDVSMDANLDNVSSMIDTVLKKVDNYS
jgi:hypothetical protein